MNEHTPKHEQNEAYPDLATELEAVICARIEQGLPEDFPGGSEIQTAFQANLHLDLYDEENKRVISLVTTPEIDDTRRSISRNGKRDITSITIKNETGDDASNIDEAEHQSTTYIFAINPRKEIIGLKKREMFRKAEQDLKPKRPGMLSRIMARVSERKREDLENEQRSFHINPYTTNETVLFDSKTAAAAELNSPDFVELIEAVKTLPISSVFIDKEKKHRDSLQAA